ncbi:MAG: Glutaredoxin-3 [Pelotomaculum sp. PtaU1.Bin035]|nr:MAG: Glutaredoxin-3 [Pelotomaculum sp. PtaU1.Bin035]
MARDVTVYTTSTCPHCSHVKEFLSQKGVRFKEFNVADDERARDEMVRKTGRMAVPTIIVDGHVVVGFNRSELEKLLMQ